MDRHEKITTKYRLDDNATLNDIFSELKKIDSWQTSKENYQMLFCNCFDGK